MLARSYIVGLVALVSATAGVLAMTALKAAPPQAQPGWIVHLETNWDRPGADYRVQNVGDNPGECQGLCAYDSRCASFTYVRRGIQGPSARCYLKTIVPPRVYNTCCTSAVKYSAQYGYDLESDINRPGGDAQQWKVASVLECRNRCQTAGGWCRAFTFVKGNGMCYLKNSYNGKVGNNCCVSGVIRPYDSAYAY